MEPHTKGQTTLEYEVIINGQVHIYHTQEEACTLYESAKHASLWIWVEADTSMHLVAAK